MDDLKLKLTNPQHIEQTPSAYPEEKKAKAANAAKEFESLLTSMMLKSMTQSNGGLFGKEGEGADNYDVIFQSSLSSFITKSRGMGIAEQVYKKLTGEAPPTDFKTGKFPASQRVNIDLDSIKNLPSVQPSDSSMQRLEKFGPAIEEASQKFGVDQNVIKAIILAESAGNVKAVSKANAKGLMQLMDGTAKDMGVRNVWNARDNVMGGTKYFAQMLEQYGGNIKLALAAYNAGPGNVDKYNGIPPFTETKGYVARVLGYLQHLES